MIATTFSSFHEVSLGQRRETFFVSSVDDFSTAITFVTLLPSFFFEQGSVFPSFFLRLYLKKLLRSTSQERAFNKLAACKLLASLTSQSLSFFAQ